MGSNLRVYLCSFLSRLESAADSPKLPTEIYRWPQRECNPAIHETYLLIWEQALFFLFACVGNLTYVFSIFAFQPICSSHRHGHFYEDKCKEGEAWSIYSQYILVNLSWIIGSAGTLGLDFTVFAQFFMYRDRASDDEVIVDDVSQRVEGEGRGTETNDR